MPLDHYQFSSLLPFSFSFTIITAIH